MTIELKTLISKLDRSARKVLEQAATICVSQTHFDVEPEHLLLALVKAKDAVVMALLGRYGIDAPALEREIEEALGKLKRGNGRTPAFSPRLPDMLEKALLTSVAVLETPTIAVPTLLVAPLEKDPLRGLLLDSMPLLARIDVAEALELLPDLVRDKQAPKPRTAPALGAAPEATTPSGGEKTALDQYTIDLTALAKAGKIDPVTARESEIRQLVDVMMRRRQNNPILVGDPGVGKTAVVEGLALRIAAGDVPAPLRPMVVRSLDLGLLQAGAGVKGEFEDRLKRIIAEVAAQPTPVVIFIDEAHALIGAGGAAGQGDAANLLKPALARGEFRTIAATTWSEYKRYFEKDPALARRFQPIKVAEPDEAAAASMLRGLVGKLEGHHGVRILDEAIMAAVSLSARYIPARQLPDKAISVLDTASARVAVGRGVVPEAIDTLDREAETLATEKAILDRQPGGGDPGRLAAIASRQAEAAAERAALAARWDAEKVLVARLDEALANGAPAETVRGLRSELSELQGDRPLVSWCVDEAVVAAVISEWTGIPAGSMSRDDAEAVRTLESKLAERIVGQDQAVTAISRAVRGYRAGLGEPGRPVGVFLLCGPSGVGKTETASALADLLYGGEGNLVTVNMSEYQEAHSVATLRGAPPGYVGYGQGGVLTEAVRRRPYSVVLLDEVEKAHPDVLDMFYQVFDKGVLEDGEGVEVDFKHTLILLTSNLGEEELGSLAAGMRNADGAQRVLEMAVEVVSPVLRRRFRPAFLGRLTVVPYLPLAEADVRRIVDMRCDRIARRFADRQGSGLSFTEAAREEIVRRALVADSGARLIDNVLNGTVIPELASSVLDSMVTGSEVGTFEVDADVEGRLVCRRTAEAGIAEAVA
ncbi:type VI secretion system ATPase TssH [Arenibaculum pallidiluteum]|uniref:type VI secretion system ATPase TssH n=1 Tax=Arenibaculum pallidiluteum TaxID=2812559 RepID=UPI001A9649DA|nr:type VI secretion system ATPase TssH [Arenibaculum pallidiluteum]